MSASPIVYVGRRPCGCQKGVIVADAPEGIASVGKLLKNGGSIHTLDATAAAAIPTRCEECSGPPVPEQLGLFDATA